MKAGFPPLLLAIALVLAPATAFANASGCTRLPGSPQMYGGWAYCGGSSSGYCYECIYSDPFGSIYCAEAPDQSVMLCGIDYQMIPW